MAKATDMQALQSVIEAAFIEQAQFSARHVPNDIKHAINETIDLLDCGKVRVAEKIAEKWHVHAWLKKAVLLYFRTHDNHLIAGSFTRHFDKIPLKFSQHTQEEFTASGIRVVPPAIARKGAYIAPGTILMPSYINICAY